MKKNKIIILTFFIFFIFSKTLANDEIVVPKEDRNNLKITMKVMEILENIGEKILKMFGSFNKREQFEKTLENNRGSNDDYSSVKAIEETGLFDGDIMLTSDQAEKIVEEAVEVAENIGVDLTDLNIKNENTRTKRKINANKNTGWKFPIKYFVESDNGDLIDQALKLMENETCIKFSKQTSIPLGEPGLKYFRGRGCWSYVGIETPNMFQDVSIGHGCDTIGTVQHETMHALGSTHEQCRSDRDDYLDIIYKNVKPNHLKNFIKLNNLDAITYGTKFDYGSDMHYHSRTFGIGESETMIPKDLVYLRTIGVNNGLSFLDAKLLNSHYCSNKCHNTIKCYNGGYQDPNNCRVCKCVEGYDGDKCNKLPKPKEECGESLYHATEQPQIIILEGSRNCLYHLKAPHGSKVIMDIIYLDAYPAFTYVCMKENSLEIKFIEDKTPTGALFCFTNEKLSVSSRNDHAIIHYRSTQRDNNMTLAFYAI